MVTAEDRGQPIEASRNRFNRFISLARGNNFFAPIYFKIKNDYISALSFSIAETSV